MTGTDDDPLLAMLRSHAEETAQRSEAHAAFRERPEYRAQVDRMQCDALAFAQTLQMAMIVRPLAIIRTFWQAGHPTRHVFRFPTGRTVAAVGARAHPRGSASVLEDYSPTTRTGVCFSVVVPSPSSPKMLAPPQQ